jgi:hypothetical protein
MRLENQAITVTVERRGGKGCNGCHVSRGVPDIEFVLPDWPPGPPKFMPGAGAVETSSHGGLMVMPEVHRMFFHYSEFPLSMRALFTGALITLGIGYVFAMIQIYASHSGRDGKPGLSAEDIVIAYSGSKDATKLEGALLGPMSGMLPAEEGGNIVGWIRRGLDKSEFDANIAPIIAQRCLACHDGSNPHIANLDGYENVSKVAVVDTGMSLYTLVRVSHIHLFGLTFIFFIMGLIFSHAYVRPVWFKALIVVLPFLALVVDIFSWYLTKIHPGFAWVVMISGGVYGVCFAVEWIVSMYQIWLYKFAGRKPPDAAATI